MRPEGYSEILDTLIDLGIRNASEPARQKLAEDCARRRVDPRDIRLAFERVVSIDAKGKTDAARMVAAQLASGETWEAYVDSARKALREVQGQAKAPQEHDHGKGLQTRVRDVRLLEYEAMGLGTELARSVEAGGYAHARIVGDNRTPAEVAAEIGRDPWETVHCAAHWADVCGGGREALRKALERQVKMKRARESVLEELDAYPVQRTKPREEAAKA